MKSMRPTEFFIASLLLAATVFAAPCSEGDESCIFNGDERNVNLRSESPNRHLIFNLSSITSSFDSLLSAKPTGIPPLNILSNNKSSILGPFSDLMPSGFFPTFFPNQPSFFNLFGKDTTTTTKSATSATTTTTTTTKARASAQFYVADPVATETEAPVPREPVTTQPATKAPTTKAPVTTAPTTKAPFTTVSTTKAVVATTVASTKAPVTTAPATTAAPVGNLALGPCLFSLVLTDADADGYTGTIDGGWTVSITTSSSDRNSPYTFINSLPVAVPDGGLASSNITISVAGLSSVQDWVNSITDVSVSLNNINETAFLQLAALVVAAGDSPKSGGYTLLSDFGGVYNFTGNIAFGDQFQQYLPDTVTDGSNYSVEPLEYLSTMGISSLTGYMTTWLSTCSEKAVVARRGVK